MQNPDNKDFYREDLVNDLNLENNEEPPETTSTTPKPKPEGKRKRKPKPEAKKDAQAKAKVTRAALLKKLAGLQGKGAPKEAQEEEEEEDEDEESEEDPPEVE